MTLWLCFSVLFFFLKLVTVRHDSPHEPRADSEAALPVVTSGTVVANKHTPLHRRHEPTPLRA